MRTGDPLSLPSTASAPAVTSARRPHVGQRLWAAVDPASSLVEVLIAVVLALGIITGVRAGLFGDLTPRDTALVILATALAWGIIDGGLYLVASKMDQGRLDHLPSELRGADLTSARRRALAAEAFALDLDDGEHPHLVAVAYDVLADALTRWPPTVPSGASAAKTGRPRPRCFSGRSWSAPSSRSPCCCRSPQPSSSRWLRWSGWCCCSAPATYGPGAHGTTGSGRACCSRSSAH
ncbi:MAG: hypothetical protein ABI112_08095 [Terracoccus sp.]